MSNAIDAGGPLARSIQGHEARDGQRSMAEALLDAGAKVNTVDEYGETPLTLAAANGDGALVQRLRLEGIAVRWAQTCAAAVTELRRRMPDFVLADIRLPDGSGVREKSRIAR